MTTRRYYKSTLIRNQVTELSLMKFVHAFALSCVPMKDQESIEKHQNLDRQRHIIDIIMATGPGRYSDSIVRHSGATSRNIVSTPVHVVSSVLIVVFGQLFLLFWSV